tara:strand:+ start:79 stop:1455 length:1377 start_codon:yes stop_codon:yes gene_type:complete
MADFYGADQGDLYSSVAKWRGWVSSANEKHRELSHTLFTGGKFDIPDVRHEEFLSTYARDIGNRVPHYLNELRTAVFKMFLDIDYVGGEYQTETDALALCVFAQALFRQFYPSVGPSAFIAVICTAPAKLVSNGVKTGIHLHFPHLLVSTTEAMLMRKMLVCRLEESTLASPSNGWDDAVDEKVFIPRNSGLRMLGSCKVEPCSHCSVSQCAKPSHDRVDNNSCETCLGKGRVRQNRPYSLVLMLNGNGFVDAQNTSLYVRCFVKALFLCSIRCVNKVVTPGFVRIVGCPSFMPLEAVRGRSGAGGGYKQVTSLKGEKSRALDNQSVVEDPHVLTRVEWIVRNVFRHPAYATLKVQRVTFNPRTRVYTVRIKPGQLGANFCLNKMADHTSSNIYFQILTSGAVQRCWCNKADSNGRQNGPCSAWISCPRSLSTNDVHVLFGPPCSPSESGWKRKTPAA